MLGDLWSFQGRYRTLHLTWIAFFLTFVVWFNLAPLATHIEGTLPACPDVFRRPGISCV